MEASDATALLQKMLASELQKSMYSICLFYFHCPFGETRACKLYITFGPQLWSSGAFIKALKIFNPVLLVLARIEFNFFTVACIVLSFGIVTKAVLIRLRGMF